MDCTLRSSRISASCLVLALLLPTGCGREGGRNEDALAESLPRLPGTSILVVSFDALRADALGVYGYARGNSPNIDAFARQALVFDTAHSAAPVTPTSFAAAFTGRLPHRSLVQWRVTAEETLAEIFAANGYRTAAFLNNAQLAAERGFGRGFEDYRLYPSGRDEPVLDEALAWIGRRGAEPWLAWVHFISPHAPYDIRDIAKDLYDPDYRGPYERTSGIVFDAPDRPEDRKRLRDLYDGEVRWADELFGRIVRSLEASDHRDDTVVVLTADHGDEFGERGYWQHRHLTEETTRIPLLIRHPGVRRHHRTHVAASNLDLLPTLAALAGIRSPDGLDGVDLALPTDGRRRLVSIAMTDQAPYLAASVRQGSRKLIQTCLPLPGVELYDLDTDSREVANLAATERREVARLRALLAAELGGEPCAVVEATRGGRAPEAGLPEELVEELRALGYLR